jgi:hypothetical protein
MDQRKSVAPVAFTQFLQLHYAPFKHLLNAKNVSGQHGFLVVEPVCENPVTQADTLKEGSCNGFSQDVFTQQMVGKHVTITGAYVTDME